MKKLSSLVLSIILLVTIAAPALAFNPQPEPPALTNKLDAVTNQLTEIRTRFDRVLAHPPEPGKSANGTVGQLRAMANQLGVLQGQLAIIDDNEPPPDDQTVLNAMLRVRAGAQAIIDDNRNHPPPDDGRVADAIAGVAGGAAAIVAIIDDNLPAPGGPGGAY